MNQSRPEEITMREDLSSITFVGDDGFGKFMPLLHGLVYIRPPVLSWQSIVEGQGVIVCTS